MANLNDQGSEMFATNRLGLVQSLETMRLQTEKLNQISNNLANTDTPGYKKDIVAFQEMLTRAADGGQRIGRGIKIATDFQPEQMEETGNPLHVAIAGDGFFRIQTPQGIRYTRDGNFTLSADNQLVTQDGNQVLGEGGPIQLGPGTVTIDAQGGIHMGDQTVAKLAIVSFANKQALEKEGKNLLRLKDQGTSEEPPASFSVRQGYLETSGVEPMSEMIAMIELSRSSESEQKMIHAIDSLDGMAVGQVGKLAG
ncbi:MAG: flagellar basal-body rod protein FlgF [Desulfobacteraceae bacterium]|nr:flagellar basal-body rod protein FlgF [Desulfobacteraceae bacterium]